MHFILDFTTICQGDERLTRHYIHSTIRGYDHLPSAVT